MLLAQRTGKNLQHSPIPVIIVYISINSQFYFHLLLRIAHMLYKANSYRWFSVVIAAPIASRTQGWDRADCGSWMSLDRKHKPD